MSRFENMQNFVAVVDAQSITAAAERLDITVAAVSKRLKALEAELGTRLLTRTTRQLSLTEAGEYYYFQCQKILQDLEQTEQHLHALQGQLSGQLRINMPMSYGKLRLMPLLLEFARLNPEIILTTQLDDAYVDAASGEYDVVIRIGKLDDSRLIARPLENCELLLVASPAYLQRYGTPGHPADLNQHRCLHYSNVSQRGGWIFRDVNNTELRVQPQVCMAANNGEILMQAAEAGIGIALQPDFIVQQALQTGAVQQVLSEFTMPPLSVFAVYPSRQFLPGKTRAVVEYLSAQLPADINHR